MDLKEARDILIAHFEDTEWPWDLDEEKLFERSSLSEEPYKAGWTVVEIERHRAILGASYRRGQPMAAFQTYWMRYAVHPETGEVEELPDEQGEICIDDVSSLVDEMLEDSYGFTITPVEGGKYLMRETVSKYERVICSFDDAKAFALEVAAELGENFQTLIEDEGLPGPEDQLKQLSDEYKEIVNARVVGNVEDLWKAEKGLLSV